LLTVQTKEFQNQSINCIENLSNELIYEIFDYLDGYDLYQAFSNLNHHFQQLINSSCLLFKIKFYRHKPGDILKNNLKQMIHYNKQQIYSIHLFMEYDTDKFFSSIFIIDSSFNRLESLALSELDPDAFRSIMVKLPLLPRLFSLTINMCYASRDLTDTYELIFALPVLKYCKFATGDEDLTVSLPIATNQQFTPIEYLVLDHCCTFHELLAITSYTPELRRLKFTHDLDGDRIIQTISPMTLSNLTHLSIHVYNLTFDTFEIFINKLYAKLKFLYVKTDSQDITYLVANRWEHLILQYLPQLERFCLQYHEYIDDDFIFPTYLGEVNQFTSSFWIERQWLLEVEIDFEYIIYSIQSYKHRWYEDKSVNSFIDLSKSARLNITDMLDNKPDKAILMHIKRILNVAQIYHLEISVRKQSLGKFLRILTLLPDLLSLKIYSLFFDQEGDIDVGERNLVRSIFVRSKITKVYLEKLMIFEEALFLMLLCPSMNHFRVNCINTMDIESYLQSILKEINDEYNNLHSLCFRVPAVDDQMIKTLDKMINDKKLLTDFTIKRVLENVYIQWK